MNRKERREYEKQLRKKGVTQADIDLFFKMLATDRKPFHNGDKVRINAKKIMEHPDYQKMRKDYSDWLMEHKDQVFTISNAKAGFLKTYAELEEDTTEPKWLWCSEDLDLVEEGESFES